MPLTLRRRPRLPDDDRAPTAAAIDAFPAEAAAAPPAAAPAAPPPAPATRRPRRARSPSASWRDRMLGEVFFFLLGLGTWLSNAIFTVLGVTASVGLTPLSALLGFAFHLLLSRAELYLWHRWRDPWYLLVLVGCVLIDAGTTLIGLLPLAARWLPGLVGSTPLSVVDWGQLAVALTMGTQLPPWWPHAVILLVIAFGFALGSERLLRKFHRGMVETWQERPRTA
jgi:hypothetical protein